MLLRYAFEELNLYRVGAGIAAYNLAALGLFRKFGFQQEVCRRESLALDGKRWDVHLFGLLRSEWQGIETLDTGQIAGELANSRNKDED
jgi:RimJ/RimL family protein N-acetyltransferase